MVYRVMQVQELLVLRVLQVEPLRVLRVLHVQKLRVKSSASTEPCGYRVPQDIEVPSTSGKGPQGTEYCRYRKCKEVYL